MRRTDNKVEDPSNLAALDTEPICVFRDSRPRPSRRRGRTHRIDGLKVRITDGPTLSDAEFARALRMLARMMVRNHQAIDAASPSSSTLTVLPHPRPDEDTNNEAA